MAALITMSNSLVSFLLRQVFGDTHFYIFLFILLHFGLSADRKKLWPPGCMSISPASFLLNQVLAD